MRKARAELNDVIAAFACWAWRNKVSTKRFELDGELRYEGFFVDGQLIGTLSIGRHDAPYPGATPEYWYCYQGSLDAPFFLSLEEDIGEGNAYWIEYARAKARRAIKTHLSG